MFHLWYAKELEVFGLGKASDLFYGEGGDSAREWGNVQLLNSGAMTGSLEFSTFLLLPLYNSPVRGSLSAGQLRKITVCDDGLAHCEAKGAAPFRSTVAAARRTTCVPPFRLLTPARTIHEGSSPVTR